MSIKFKDTQLVLLSAASLREDHCLTLPSGARLAPARKGREQAVGRRIRPRSSRAEGRSDLAP
jgi:hypothetical protein